MKFEYVEKPVDGEVYLFKDPSVSKTVWKPGRVTKMVKIAGQYFPVPMVEWFDGGEPEVLMPRKSSIAKVHKGWVEAETKIAKTEAAKWQSRLDLLLKLGQA